MYKRYCLRIPPWMTFIPFLCSFANCYEKTWSSRDFWCLSKLFRNPSSSATLGSKYSVVTQFSNFTHSSSLIKFSNFFENLGSPLTILSKKCISKYYKEIKIPKSRNDSGLPRSSSVMFSDCSALARFDLIESICCSTFFTFVYHSKSAGFLSKIFTSESFYKNTKDFFRFARSSYQ